MKRASLYMLDAGHKDEKDEPDVVLVISSLDEKELREDGQSHDSGGLNTDVFYDNWRTGKITKITSLDQIPVGWVDNLVYETSELNLLDMSPFEFLTYCDEEFTINAKEWHE